MLCYPEECRDDSNEEEDVDEEKEDEREVVDVLVAVEVVVPQVALNVLVYPENEIYLL